jgi:dTDP-glucose 4,6-dehydratase
MAKRFSRILVTGGAGFIGSHIVDRLLSEDFEVTAYDDMSFGRPENLSQNKCRKEFHFVRGDIRDCKLLRNTLKNVDAVFHEAALVSVARSIKEPLLTNDLNIVGTLNVLKAASDQGVKRFVFASSAAVYGNTPSKKISEDVAPNPVSPYGVSKVTGELYAKYFYKVHGLETVSLRCFNAYGPRQTLDSQSPYSGVITIFLNKLLSGVSPTIFGDGEQTRDFVYVEDVVQANMLALNSKNAAGEIFNVGNGVSVSVNEVAETLNNILKKKHLKTVHVSPRRGDIRHSCADITKAKETLGYKPNFSFEEGIRKLVEWYSEEHV